MKEFPDRIHVNNKENFDNLCYERFLCYLRRDVFEHLIKRKNDENNYFELDVWFRNQLKKPDASFVEKMSKKIIEELEAKGWKCKTAFGGTGLFVYSTEDPPPSCYEDGF